ncbi:hypothetical protein LTR36_001539 [Oleoguttula mirabilis]|uniref:Pheromone alpha factor receptor n=1 Tax=Oleoguttula mirabilis TaxID=1507867 RepID=A0AAV9JMN2_9PEZI|nr:hypothetical protein LTR36_001539 [Oleoguttula mirabilis]
MDTQNWQTNSSFDPYTQTFVVTAPDGVTALPGYMDELLLLQSISVTQGIIYGIQLGLAGLLLVVLMLMTKRDKRRSAVFLLNSLALLLLLIRNILTCTELHSIFYNYYNWQLHYYPKGGRLHTAQNLSITAEIFNFLIDAAIYSSLLLQVHIICCTIARTVKLGIIGVATAVALMSLGVRLYLAVFNIEYSILGVNSLTIPRNAYLTHIASVNNIVTVVTIALFSTIFVTKLAFAIHMRRKLNMKQFGPMQIIFVMGCQTLFVPLIFAIVSYYSTIGSQINSFVPTVVAVFLPLSGMWASAHVIHQKPRRDDGRYHRAIPVGATDLSSAQAYGSAKSMGTADTADDTLIGDDEIELRGSSSTSNKQQHTMHAMTVSPSSGGGGSSGHSGMHGVDEDLEMQQLKSEGVVVVDRTYSVRSD